MATWPYCWFSESWTDTIPEENKGTSGWTFDLLIFSYIISFGEINKMISEQVSCLFFSYIVWIVQWVWSYVMEWLWNYGIRGCIWFCRQLKELSIGNILICFLASILFLINCPMLFWSPRLLGWAFITVPLKQEGYIKYNCFKVASSLDSSLLYFKMIT